MSDVSREEETEQSLEKRPPEKAAELGLGASQANDVEAATGEPTAPEEEEADSGAEMMNFHEGDSPDQTNRTVNPSSLEHVADNSASDLTLNFSPKEGTRGEKPAGSGGDGGSAQPNGSKGASAAAEESGRKSEAQGEGEGEEEWIDVLGNGQLKKKIIRPGEGETTRPTPLTRVKMRTKGTLEGGGVVDKHSKVTFTVGDGDVIQAWDLVASLMQKGEVVLVRTEPRFAYGQTGRAPDVPPNASITYELEMLEVLEPVDFETATEDEVISLVDKKRIRGNELFQRKEFLRAINSYQKALQMIQNYLEGQHLKASEAIQDMQIRCWNNLAASQLKAGAHKEGLESCERVLKVDPDNVKALFRAGKLLSITSTDLDAAVKHLQKAAALKPEEKAIQAELQKTVRRRDRLKQEEREMYRRMVEGRRGTGEEERKKAPRKEWGPLPYLAIAASIAAVGIGLAYFITQRH